MLSTSSAAPFKEEMFHWLTRLARVRDMLKNFRAVQASWSALETVFADASAEISRQMPNEVKRFVSIDQSYSNLLEVAVDKRGVLSICDENPTVRSIVPHLEEQLELSQKALASFLERKRRAFARLFFVSDSALLRLCRATGSDDHGLPTMNQALRETIPQVMPEIASLGGMDADNGLLSEAKTQDGELLQFSLSVPVSLAVAKSKGGASFPAEQYDKIETVLADVELQIVQAVTDGISSALTTLNVAADKPLGNNEITTGMWSGMLREYSFQALKEALFITWTQEMERCLSSRYVSP